MPSFKIIITSQQGFVQPADRADRLKKRGGKYTHVPILYDDRQPKWRSQPNSKSCPDVGQPLGANTKGLGVYTDPRSTRCTTPIHPLVGHPGVIMASPHSVLHSYIP